MHAFSKTHLLLLIVALASLRLDAQEEPSPAAREAQILFMLDELMYRADDERAEHLAQEILKTSELNGEELLELMRRPLPLPQMPTGLVKKERQLGIEGHSYQSYVQVPENYDPSRFWPLLITVHGTGGEGLAPLTALQEDGAKLGFFVASVSETADRHGKGWGYSAEERQVLVDFIRELKAEYQIDSRRVFMNGWSRGGHASWDIALRYPSLLAGIGPIIGAVPARDLALTPNLIGLRVDAVNGALDQAELVQAMQDVTARMTELKVDFRALMDPERGHDGFGDRLQPMMEFLAKASRPLAPGRVAISSYEKFLDRHDWLEIATFGRKLYQPGQKITIPGVSKMDAEQRRRAWLEHIEAHCAQLTASVEPGNKIVLSGRNVKRVRLLLPPEGISLEAPVEIWWQGKRLRRSHVKASSRDLLRSLVRSRDPYQAYPAKLEVSLP